MTFHDDLAITGEQAYHDVAIADVWVCHDLAIAEKQAYTMEKS